MRSAHRGAHCGFDGEFAAFRHGVARIDGEVQKRFRLARDRRARAQITARTNSEHLPRAPSERRCSISSMAVTVFTSTGESLQGLPA